MKSQSLLMFQKNLILSRVCFYSLPIFSNFNRKWWFEFNRQYQLWDQVLWEKFVSRGKIVKSRNFDQQGNLCFFFFRIFLKVFKSHWLTVHFSFFASLSFFFPSVHSFCLLFSHKYISRSAPFKILLSRFLDYHEARNESWYYTQV